MRRRDGSGGPEEPAGSDAAEIADAAVTAALVVGLLAAGRVLTLGGVAQVLATGVVAVLAARRTTRTVVLATAAATVAAVLLGGTGPVTAAVVAGLFGWTGGTTLAAGRGPLRGVARALVVAWPVVAASTVAALSVFADLRRLTLANARNQFVGVSRAAEEIGLDVVGRRGLPVVDWLLDHWYLAVPGAQIGVSVVYALVVHRMGAALLARVDDALGPPSLVGPVPADRGDPAPLPVHLDGVVVARRHAAPLPVAVGPATVAGGAALALTGSNGGGKSTLLEALAGLHPVQGISRPGPIGLGRAHGTALVRQRPETGVLGARVVDDVRWGLPPDADPHAALAAVGLDHLAGRSTAELSGGELQRLALAAALARRPALLLADEVTAMLDPAGRARVAALLARAAADGVAVVAATHLTAELGPDARILPVGRIPGGGTPPVPGIGTPPADPAARAAGTVRSGRGRRPAHLRLDAVGYTHRAGTPWAATALEGIELEARGGDLVRVLGPNGSGKTTLVRLLAGLAPPTTGRVLLDGDPIVAPQRRVGVAFQRARLQLQRATVGEEVRALAGHDDIEESLRAMGFAPGDVEDRRIDELSGGQQRRVLLAGLLARGPDVLVLDEPAAGLDATTLALLGAALDALLGNGVLVVVVTHDPAWLTGRRGTDVVLTRPGGAGGSAAVTVAVTVAGEGSA